jgi:hypothetical protein
MELPKGDHKGAVVLSDRCTGYTSPVLSDKNAYRIVHRSLLRLPIKTLQYIQYSQAGSMMVPTQRPSPDVWTNLSDLYVLGFNTGVVPEPPYGKAKCAISTWMGAC